MAASGRRKYPSMVEASSSQQFLASISSEHLHTATFAYFSHRTSFFFLNLFFLPSVTFFSHFSSFLPLTLFARGHTAASSECRVLFEWRFRWLLPWLDGSHFRHWLVLAAIDDEAHRRPRKRQETYSLGTFGSLDATFEGKIRMIIYRGSIDSNDIQIVLVSSCRKK